MNKQDKRHTASSNGSNNCQSGIGAAKEHSNGRRLNDNLNTDLKASEDLSTNLSAIKTNCTSNSAAKSVSARTGFQSRQMSSLSNSIGSVISLASGVSGGLHGHNTDGHPPAPNQFQSRIMNQIIAGHHSPDALTQCKKEVLDKCDLSSCMQSSVGYPYVDTKSSCVRTGLQYGPMSAIPGLAIQDETISDSMDSPINNFSVDNLISSRNSSSLIRNNCLYPSCSPPDSSPINSYCTPPPTNTYPNDRVGVEPHSMGIVIEDISTTAMSSVTGHLTVSATATASLSGPNASYDQRNGWYTNDSLEGDNSAR